MRWPSASNVECTRLVEYEILDELAFSSELKRMGILVRAKDTGQVSCWHGLHLCAPEAATLGCNPRCEGLQPLVREAASLGAEAASLGARGGGGRPGVTFHVCGR